jgi:hypothetical protein
MQISNFKSINTAYPNRNGNFVVNNSWNIINGGKSVLLLGEPICVNRGTYHPLSRYLSSASAVVFSCQIIAVHVTMGQLTLRSLYTK